MYKRVTISSADAVGSADGGSSYDSCNFTVRLSQTNIGYKKVELVSVTLENKFYNVTANNNQIAVTDAGGSFTASITRGAYSTASDLCSAVASALTSGTSSGSTYTATYNSITQKMTIAISAGTFALNFASLSNSAAKLLGFAASNLSAAASQIATNAVRLRFGSVFAIVNGLNYGVTSAGFSYTYQIPLFAAIGETQLYEPQEPARQLVPASGRFNNVSIKLIDAAGNLLTNRDTIIEFTFELSAE